MFLSSKASNGLSRKERSEALEKSRALAPFIDLVNKPDDPQQLLQKIVPSYNQVSAHLSRPLAPPPSWRDEEIEDYIEAQKRAEEELGNKLTAIEEERQAIAYLLGTLADRPQSSISPLVVDPVELPVGHAHQTRLVFGAQNRIHVEPLFPEIAELWKAFLKALDGLDRSRIRKCPACSNIYWAVRVDKPACSALCVGRLRSERFYETVKRERGQVRQLREEGQNVSDIASRLGLSTSKVRHHLEGGRKKRKERKR